MWKMIHQIQRMLKKVIMKIKYKFKGCGVLKLYSSFLTNIKIYKLSYTDKKDGTC